MYFHRCITGGPFTPFTRHVSRPYRPDRSYESLIDYFTRNTHTFPIRSSTLATREFFSHEYPQAYAGDLCATVRRTFELHGHTSQNTNLLRYLHIETHGRTLFPYFGWRIISSPTLDGRLNSERKITRPNYSRSRRSGSSELASQSGLTFERMM